MTEGRRPLVYGPVPSRRLGRSLGVDLVPAKVCSLDFVNRVSDNPSSLSGAWNNRDVVFVPALWEGDEQGATRVAPLVPNKHLSLVDPGLSVEVRVQDDQLVCEVTAGSLARFVELSLDGVDVVWSDNYFDVPGGRTVAVTCPLPEGWTVDRVRGALAVRSLYDSFT